MKVMSSSSKDFDFDLQATAYWSGILKQIVGCIGTCAMQIAEIPIRKERLRRMEVISKFSAIVAFGDKTVLARIRDGRFETYADIEAMYNHYASGEKADWLRDLTPLEHSRLLRLVTRKD